MAADPPRLILRADAGAAIGLGHLTRARVLAAQARARGWDVALALGGDATVPDAIPVAGGPGDWARGQGACGQGARGQGAPALVVVDTLWSGNAAATAAEVAVLRGLGQRVAVIDSMPPDHYRAGPDGAWPDLLVTPYAGAHALRPPPAAGRWLHGPEHALLDPAYADWRARLAGRPLPARLLVSCGGADPGGLSAGILQRLAQPDTAASAAVDLVVGPMFAPAQRDRIAVLARDLPGLRLHPAPQGLAGLVAGAGSFAGRLGLIRYEAAALGRQGLWLHEGPAYRPYLERFAAAGLGRVFFADDPGGRAAFLDAVAAAAIDPAPALNAAGLAAVDGLGVSRLLDALAGLWQEGGSTDGPPP